MLPNNARPVLSSKHSRGRVQHRWQPGWSNECKWRFIGTTNVHNGLRAAAWGTGTPEVFIAAATSEYYTQPSARAGEFRVPCRSPPEARDDDSGGRHRRSGASRSGRVDGRPHNTDKPRRSHVSPKHRRKKRSRCGLLSVKNLEMSRHTRRRGDVRQKDTPPLAGGRPSRERRPRRPRGNAATRRIATGALAKRWDVRRSNAADTIRQTREN